LRRRIAELGSQKGCCRTGFSQCPGAFRLKCGQE
jgi:hypothetical protein